MKDSLGNRMKENYEKRGRLYLTRRTPVILRLDGKAFHTFTKGFKRPFDKTLSDLMTDSALYLCQNIQGAKLCYVQSDEISILVTDYDNIKTDAWFNYETSKMNSIAASMCSAKFNNLLSSKRIPSKILAFFDCRSFNIPENEVMNYFRWRYRDWLRNSIQMLAQSHFSHKQLNKKNQKDMISMLEEKNVRWNELDNLWKNGTLIYRNELDYDYEVKGNWNKHTDIRFIDEDIFDHFIKAIING